MATTCFGERPSFSQSERTSAVGRTRAMSVQAASAFDSVKRCRLRLPVVRKTTLPHFAAASAASSYEWTQMILAAVSALRSVSERS